MTESLKRSITACMWTALILATLLATPMSHAQATRLFSITVSQTLSTVPTALKLAHPPHRVSPSPRLRVLSLGIDGPTAHPNLLTTAFADSVRQRPPDPWLRFDKVQHVTFSFLWTLGSQYALVNKARWSEGDALPISIAVTGVVGLSKELYDLQGPTRYFSKRDLVADALGILLGAGFILL